jgi:hypothetical protein
MYRQGLVNCVESLPKKRILMIFVLLGGKNFHRKPGCCLRPSPFVLLVFFLVFSSGFIFSGDVFGQAASPNPGGKPVAMSAAAEPTGGDASVGNQFVTDESASEQDLIEAILEIRLGSFILTDGIFAFLDRRGVLFLPLRDYMEALEFPIRVDTDGARASGWFMSENRLFSLNLNKGEVVVEGKVERFDKSLVRIIQGDLFVDVRLLAQWFPVDIEYDLSNLLMTLTTREPIPLEQRIARDERRKKVLGRGQGRATEFETADNPYHWLT